MYDRLGTAHRPSTDDLTTMEIVNKFAPQVRPHLWLKVNGFVFLYSLVILFINTFGTDDSRGVEISEASYLYYTWITTLIWAAFVGLELSYEHWQTHSWERRIEFFIAVVFAGISLHELLEWRLKDQNVVEMEFDLFMNTVAYFYQTRKSYLTLRQGYEAVDEGEAPASLIV